MQYGRIIKHIEEKNYEDNKLFFAVKNSEHKLEVFFLTCGMICFKSDIKNNYR